MTLFMNKTQSFALDGNRLPGNPWCTLMSLLWVTSRRTSTKLDRFIAKRKSRWPCDARTRRDYKPRSSVLREERVVPYFSSRIVKRAKRERAWKSPHSRKSNTRRGERKIRGPSFFSPTLLHVAFSCVGWFSRALAFCLLYYPWRKMRDYL